MVAWDRALTSALVLWLIFGAYLLLRRFGGPGSERLAAAVALFGMANVPFVYWSVNLWRTLHPKTTVVSSLPVAMGLPVLVLLAAFLGLAWRAAGAADAAREAPQRSSTRCTCRSRIEPAPIADCDWF